MTLIMMMHLNKEHDKQKYASDENHAHEANKKL